VQEGGNHSDVTAKAGNRNDNEVAILHWLEEGSPDQGPSLTLTALGAELPARLLRL
jgi:hypothetical protein